MEIKLPLLACAIVSCIALNAQATPSTIATGDNIKITAEDVFQTGQLFNSPIVAAGNSRAIHLNENGTVLTTEISDNNDLHLVSQQRLANVIGAHFTLSADGKTLIYLNASKPDKIFLATWNDSTKQWNTPELINTERSLPFTQALQLESNLLSISTSDTVQFYQLRPDAGKLTYITQLHAPNHTAVYSIQNSHNVFVVQAKNDKAAHQTLGTLFNVDTSTATIESLAQLPLNENDSAVFHSPSSKVFVDARNNVVAITDHITQSKPRLFHFNGAAYQQGAGPSLPSDIEQITVLQNGVFIGQVNGTNVSNIRSINTSSSDDFIEQLAFADHQLFVTEQSMFSDNFAQQRDKNSQKTLSFARLDHANQQFAAFKQYKNGSLETVTLDANDYYKPSQHTANHWMVFPEQHNTRLLDANDPSISVAQANYKIETGCMDERCQDLQGDYFAVDQHLYGFLHNYTGSHWLETGHYQRVFIDESGDMVSGVEHLTGHNEEFQNFRAFPIPSMNGVAILTAIQIMLYQRDANDELQHVATRKDAYNFINSSHTTSAKILDDELGLLYLNTKTGEAQRLTPSEGILQQVPVSFDTAPNAASLVNASIYGAYLQLYSHGSSPTDVQIYRLDADGNYALYSSEPSPCDCIFDASHRLSDTQAFDVKDGQFIFYELNLNTKTWAQVESLGFSEDVDVQGYDRATYFGKNSTAVRRFNFAVAPALIKLPTEVSVDINSTVEVDLSTFITDANLDDTHHYSISNLPDYATLTGAQLTLSPINSSAPISLAISVTDSADLTRSFLLPIALSGEPVLRDAPPVIIDRNTLFNGSLADIAYDPDGGELSFNSADDSALPVATDGTYVGSFAHYGNYVIKATAADADQLSVEVQQMVLVNSIPTASSLAEVLITQGDTYSGSLAHAVSDNDNDALTFSTANNSAITIADNGSFTGIMPDFGRFQVSAIATDAIGQTVHVTRPVLVNAPPVALTQPAIFAPINQTVTGSLNANVTDSDSNNLTFTTSNNSSLSVNANGTFTGSFSSGGTFSVAAQVADEHGASTKVEQLYAVSGDVEFNAPDEILVNPNQTVNGDLGAALYSSNGQTLTFITASGSALNVASNGQFNGSFSSSGRYDIRATATDGNGFSIQVAQTINVNSAPVSLGLAALTIQPTDPVWIDIGATFSDPESHAMVITSSALPDGLTLNDNGVLSGTLRFDGQYQITFTATDAHGLSTTVDLTITVAYFTVRSRPADTQWRGETSLVSGKSIYQNLPTSEGDEAHGPVLTYNDRFTSLANATGRVLILPNSREILQLDASSQALEHKRFSYNLNLLYGTTAPIDLLKTDKYFYAVYRNTSSSQSIDVNVMKIFADENGDIAHSEQRLLDADGNPLNLSKFTFIEAPSLGGVVIRSLDKVLLYKQQSGGELTYVDSLEADFNTDWFKDDGRGLLYWDQAIRRLDRIELNTDTQTLSLVSSPIDITPPQTPVYADNGYLQFLFYINGSARTQFYLMDENGIYERQFAGVAPCGEVITGESKLTQHTGYCLSGYKRTLSFHHLDKTTYEWQTTDVQTFHENLEYLDKATRTAYGRLGTWLREYHFNTSPVLANAITPLRIPQNESITLDLAEYFIDYDNENHHDIRIENMPLDATLEGSQLTISGAMELDDYTLNVSVTDLQGFTLTFELPIQVNQAPIVDDAVPILIDANEAVQGNLASLVNDPEGDTLTFSALEDSALTVSLNGDYQGAFTTFGVHSIKANAADSEGLAVQVTQDIVVNSQPQSEPLNTLVVNVGQAFSASLAQGVSDADNDSLIFSTNTESDFPIASDGSFTGDGSSAGSFTASALATDPYGRSAIATQTVKVNAPPTITELATLSAQIGDTVSGSLAGAVSDANGDSLTFTTANDSVLTINSDGTFSGVINSSGTHYIKGQVSDPHGASTAISQTVIVTPIPVIITIDDMSIDNGGAISIDVSNLFPANETYLFAATNLPSGILLNSQGVLSGNSTQAGVHHITVTATTTQGIVNSVSFSLTIAEQVTPPANNGGNTGGTDNTSPETRSSSGSLLWLLGLLPCATRLRKLKSAKY